MIVRKRSRGITIKGRCEPETRRGAVTIKKWLTNARFRAVSCRIAVVRALSAP